MHTDVLWSPAARGRKVSSGTTRTYSEGIFINIRCSCNYLYFILYLNTLGTSSFCNQPLIPTAVVSGFYFNQESRPLLLLDLFSGPLPRSQELGER